MPFEKSVLVPLSADETFALITQPDRLRRWQVVTARVDLRAGGDYRWTIIPGHSVAGTLTEVEPGRRVVFTWGWEGSADLPPGASTVIITLEPATGGTMVHLVHEGLSGEQEASHAAGWTHYLDRLVTAATAGDAGSDEWAAAPALDPLSSAEATLAACQLILRGVDEADYHKATVCTEFDVTQLAEHLIGSVTYLGAAAGASAEPATGPLETPGRHGGPGHARGLARPRARRRGQGRPARDARRGCPRHPVRRVPGPRVGLRPGHRPAGRRLRRARPARARRGPPDHQSRSAGRRNFADPAEAGPDAGLLDRLVAFTGRNLH